MPISWNASLVFLSVLIAIIGSFTTLDHARRMYRSSGHVARLWMAAGSIAMGTTVWAMHYTGMAALKMSPPVSYDPLLFALSVAIAVIASWGALLLMYQGERIKPPSLLRLMLGAVIMGLAISGMHYTAMLGTHFQPGSISLAGTLRIEPDTLGTLVSSSVLFLLGGSFS